MSLTDPPPSDSTRMRMRGPGGNRFRYLRGTNKFHTIKASVASGKGKDYSLTNLQQLWTQGYPLKGMSSTMLSGPEVRWRTVKLLRIVLYKRTATAPVPAGLVPANFQGVWASGRLSTLAVEIGSANIANLHIPHLDIDWFGPQGTAKNCNWWRPSCDGAAVEVTVARGLLHYLEASLGLGPSGDTPAEWTWPKGATPASPMDGLSDFSVTAAVLALALQSGFEDIYLEWRIGDINGPPPIVALVTTHVEGHNFIIETPDVSGPNPN